MSSRHEGIALIAVVLALVVVEAAVAGALFLSSLEVRTTRTLTVRAHSILAAESAIGAAIGAWDADAVAPLALHDTMRVPPAASPYGATAQARVEHIAAGTYIVSAAATAPGPAAHAHATAAALVRWFTPAAYAAAAPGALTTGGTATVAAGATVDGGLTPAACVAADSLARITFPPAPGIVVPHAAAASVAPGASVAGSPPIISAPATTGFAAFAHIGPVDTAQLRRAADRVESGTLTLAPPPATAPCDTAAPANWGAPTMPGHPCADYVPLVFAPADLTITHGAGQALLVVGGSLTIDSAADFRGAVLVLGNATIRGRLRGALRVRGAADVHGEIRRDACALWRSFTRPRAFGRPYRTLPRWRLPTF